MQRALLWVMLCIGISIRSAGSPAISILPEFDPATPQTHQYTWETIPGVRYQPETSADLLSWTPVAGYPATAETLADVLPVPIEDTQPAFLRVLQIDEQAPALVDVVPADKAFAIRRFTRLRVVLADQTGIDPASLRLTVGTMGTYNSKSPELDFDGSTLTFDPAGSSGLGDHGETVSVSLEVTDTLGNAATYIWSFDLEVQPVVADSLFVFGSATALRSGQRLATSAARALAGSLAGVSTMNLTGEPWMIEAVGSDRIILVYQGQTPQFTIGQPLANLAPASDSEIFYRRVIGTSDDPATNRLTLFTEDIALTDIVSAGSSIADEQAVVLTFDEAGAVAKAVSFAETVQLPQIGYSYDGAEITLRDDGFSFKYADVTLEVGQKQDYASLKAEQLHFWLRSSLIASFEIQGTELKRSIGGIRGEVDAAVVYSGNVQLKGMPGGKTPRWPIYRIPRTPIDLRPGVWIFLGQIGPVPVYGKVLFDLGVEVEAEASIDLSIRSGVRMAASVECGLDYNRDRSPTVQWINDAGFRPTTVSPDFNIDGEFRCALSIEPSVSFLVYGLYGAEVSLPFSTGPVVTTQWLPAPSLRGTWESSLALAIQPDGTWLDWLAPNPVLSLELWHDSRQLFPDEDDLRFILQPVNQAVREGQSARFTAATNFSEGVRYLWHHNGRPLPSQTGPALNIANVTLAHAGTYVVMAYTGAQETSSHAAFLSVYSANPFVEAGFSYIPPGTFLMGSPDDEPGREQLYSETLHSVTLTRAFVVQQTEVTKAQWDTVAAQGPERGYTDLQTGRNGFRGDESGAHPVTEVSWLDAVKWLNLKSELNGLTPCYKVGGAVMRTGTTIPTCDFDANGYRLPTEAEWEYACRAGTNTAFHSGPITYASSSPLDPNLNLIGWYEGNSGFNTHPVAGKQPNAWGLHDMSGNVWEWCWDWGAGQFTSESVVDPTGPALGGGRAVRGGAWYYSAEWCRSASRGADPPGYSSAVIGFRPARTAVP